MAKRDQVEAGEGVVALLERLWPALQDIDTSTGALGRAVSATLEKLISLLFDAPADQLVRQKWLERLFTAIQEDGVDYLAPLEDRWGEICVFPELAVVWVEFLMPTVRRVWSDHNSFTFVEGDTHACPVSFIWAAITNLMSCFPFKPDPFGRPSSSARRLSPAKE